jgi:hypothetical protein
MEVSWGLARKSWKNPSIPYWAFETGISADSCFHRVNGFGAGPAETIAPTVIADIFFLHDRGKYNTLYFVVYFGSLMVLPCTDSILGTY